MNKRRYCIDDVIASLDALISEGDTSNLPKTTPAGRLGKPSFVAKELLKKSVTLIRANSVKQALDLLSQVIDMLDCEDLRAESVEKSRHEPVALKKAQPQNVLQMTARQQIALRNGIPVDLPGLEQMNTVSEMRQAAQRARLEGLRPVFRSSGKENRLNELLKTI